MMNPVRVTWFTFAVLYWLELNMGVHVVGWYTSVNLPVCDVSKYRYTRTAPYWRMRAFSNMAYPYGFPAEFFGGVIPAASIQLTDCGTGDKQQSSKCMHDFIPRYCHYQQHQFDRLQDTMKLINYTCPYTILPSFPKAPKTVPSNRKLLIIEPQPMWVSPNVKGDSLLSRIVRFFDNCGKCNATMNIGGLIICSFSEYMDLFRDKNLKEGEITWDITEKTVTSLYMHLFCEISWIGLWRSSMTVESNMFHPFCANPCSQRLGRCSNTSHTITAVRTPPILPSIGETSCLPLHSSYLTDRYRCLCKPGYRWDDSTRSCHAPDLCAENAREVKSKGLPESALLCSPKGTLKCVSGSSQNLEAPDTEEMYLLRSQLHTRYRCICQNAYMGVRCDRPRDACVESGVVGGIPGEEACRTYLGNKCTSHNGTDFYFCKCAENWGHDLAFSFPNCYKRRSICDRVICRNRGTCVCSNDQKAFVCLCEYGWRGRFCEIPDVRQWLTWGAWTLCSAPLCTGRGWHSRTRECRVPVNGSQDAGSCVGNTVQYRPCRSGCPDPVQTYVPMIKLILYFGCCLLVLQACTTIIYTILQMEYT